MKPKTASAMNRSRNAVSCVVDKADRPRIQRTPDKNVKDNHHEDECGDSIDRAAIVAHCHRLSEIAPEYRKAIMDRAEHDDFARDEEVPTVCPGNHAVIRELMNNGG